VPPKYRKIEEVTVHCCVCLNIDNSKQVPAFSVVKGYAVCESHVPLVSQPGFDIFSIQVKKQTKAT
jgi:hypothetical protein